MFSADFKCFHVMSSVGVSVRFVDDNPVVRENNGTVTICLERLGTTDEDITPTVRAEESSPPDAIGKNLSTSIQVLPSGRVLAGKQNYSIYF